MFTGLIEQVGCIADWQRSGSSRRLTIAHEPWQGAEAALQPGDSIAVNGACLTIDGGWWLGKGLFGEGEVAAVKRRRSSRET